MVYFAKDRLSSGVNMGKVLSLVFGIAITIVGIFFLVNWRKECVSFIKGSAPFMMIAAGLIALFAGISEVADTIKQKNIRRKGGTAKTAEKNK